MLFIKNITNTELKTMEFIVIQTFQYGSQGPSPLGEISFKSDCTENERISKDRWNGEITNLQTYCPQDVSKEQNLIFPTKFIKFFKLLSSSEFGRRFWFDDCSRGNFNEAGIDTNYDADVGDIFSGNSQSVFMRYIYRDMVVPFTKLEKENKHLREQLESKDQELEEMKEQLQRKDQELKTGLLTASTLKYVIEVNCDKLEEKDQKLKNIQGELGNIQEELDTTYQELKELQEILETKDQELENTRQELENTRQELETKDQELENTRQELETRGMLLKTLTEEIEKVEKKNQELEHLNHRLICETSSFVKKNSYFNFSPEM